MELVVTVFVFCTLTGILTWLLTREQLTSREKLIKATDDFMRFQQARISDLENRLNSHNWQEYAMLQNQVRHTEDTVPDFSLSPEQVDSIRGLSDRDLFTDDVDHMDEGSIIG